ncbi:hypothetical protein MTR67_009727 [Solanum verrucosum]|uniref:BRX domain-containing protein n=1 Tax=Solanum verrucosum TaxID=315347 RepID=A0AAF0TDL1_SOLVR|nr:hypothetical protein MTR67_009727 [Solanum verrucosum]
MCDDKVSASLTVSKITDYKLNGSNYIDWSRKIRIYLSSVEKDDHLSQDPPIDETKNAWIRDDARLFLQIINSMDNEVVGLAHHCEFVKELMDYLEYLYSGKGYASRIYEVCKAFYHPEKEAKTLTIYFMEFKKIYEELNMLLPFSTDIKVQQAQREQMAVMSFLAGLPTEFETAKSQILASSEITSLNDVFSWVLRTESTPSNEQTKVVVTKGEEKNDARRNCFFQAMSKCFLAGRETNVEAAATSTDEWVEQYQPGVYVRLTMLPSGKKGLKGFRFSRKKFTVKEVEKWWKENKLSVYKNYDK